MSCSRSCRSRSTSCAEQTTVRSDTPTAPADRNGLIASRVHTLIVLVVIVGWTLISKTVTDRLGAVQHPNRVRSYLIALAWEWLMFGLVVIGVRRARVALSAVIGPRWASWRALLTDIGIAAALWIPAVVVLQLLSKLLGITNSSVVQAMLPRGGIEIALWVALSVTAGICEETIFRGYLQRQLTVLARSSLAGILLAAAVFGAGHAYQGWRLAILDGLYGVMFGALAHWRRSVRPGMIAHAWNDGFMGIVAASMMR
jgi:uncharacterized protein